LTYTATGNTTATVQGTVSGGAYGTTTVGLLGGQIITATAGANGAISPSGAVAVSYSGSQAFTITPNTNYHVANVTVDSASQGAITSYTFNNVTAAHTIAASFAIDTYGMTASAGANGSISPTGTTSVNAGSNQSYTITPATGYHVLDVLVDGSSVGAVTSYTFSNVLAAHTIAATFDINTYTLTASAGANGTVSPSGATTVSYGGSQAYVITPDLGFHVSDVQVDGSSVGAGTGYTFSNVTASHTLAASFAINTYTVSISGGSGGAVTPSGAQTVSYGSALHVDITPTAGHHVVDVLVDGSSVGAVTSYDFSNLTGGHTLAATFAIDTFTLTLSAGAHGTVSPSGATSANYGGTQAVTITPAANYKVSDVLVDGSSIGAVTSYTFSSIAASHTLAASFALIDVPPTLTVSSGAASYTEEQPAVAIDPTLTLTDPDGPNLTSARVSISGGYRAGEDVLSFATQAGISGTFNASTGVLTLTGNATVSAWEAALRTVAYRDVSASPDVTTRQVTFSIGSSLSFPDNGHFYEFVAAPGMSWTAAKAAAEARSFYGRSGYLVTITSAAENAFVGSKLAGTGWMGASAPLHTAPRDWSWVTGPEAGTIFFTQTSDYNQACSAGPRGSGPGFQGWHDCEPNNWGFSENYAHFYSDGTWNDYPGTTSVNGYVVEYGGMPNDVVSQLTGTRDVQVHALPIFTVSASAGPNGGISPSGDQAVKQGHSVSFTITAATHYHVADVQVGGVSVGAVGSTTVANVQADVAVVASFAIDQVVVAATGDANGNISCQSPVDYGGPSVCTVTPATGYELATLLDGSSDVFAQVSNGQYTLGAVTGAHSLTATFKKSKGISCSASSDCNTGFCVDGVCCESSCDGQCEACDAAGALGTCQAITGAPHNARVECNGAGDTCGGTCDGQVRTACGYPTASTSCRAASCTAGTAMVAAACDGNGGCPALQQQDCGTYACGATACHGDCTTDSDCAGTSYCAAGVCVTKKVAGASCGVADQCGSGFCADGVCCNAACNGQCEACAEAGHAGECRAVAGIPRQGHDACGDDGTVCGGVCDGTVRTACSYPGASTSCRQASCGNDTATLSATCDGQGACPAKQTQGCGTFVCGATACLGDCQADGDCATGFWCSGGVCAPKLQPGTACSASDQCGTGSCVDGVCCNTACNGQCEACDVSGHVGTCTPTVGEPTGGRPACGSDGSSCGGTCDGHRTATCTYPGAETVCAAPSCAAGVATLPSFCDHQGACPAPEHQSCGQYTCGSAGCMGDCTTDTDCTADAYCSAGVCAPKKVAGASCSAADQCGSGFCTDGVCCNVACDGQCEACAQAGSVGTCAPVTGAPKGHRVACSSDGTACGGACDGTHAAACTYAGASVSCRGASCSEGTATAAASCEGTGHCPSPVANSCARYVCGDAACKTSCSADADCSSGLTCFEGACKTADEVTTIEHARLAGNATLGGGSCGCATPGSPLSVLLALGLATFLRRRR
jgi:hypothetical protein